MNWINIIRNFINMIRHELIDLRLSDKERRSFVYLMSLIFVFFAVLSFMKEKGLLLSSLFLFVALFLCVGLFRYPRMISKIQEAWMGLAIILGFIMTRVLLLIVFFALMTPLSALMKIFSKNPLRKELTLSYHMKTYWKDVPEEASAKERMKRLF